jgi:hypothetical protein
MWFAAGAALIFAACSGSSSGGNSGSSSGSSSGAGSSSGSGSGSGSSSGGGSLPTISISSPAAGATVTPTKNGTEEDIPVAFTLTNFTLKPPNGCGSVSKTCGHIHVLVDDANSCLGTGVPYNNDDETGSPGTVIISQCTGGTTQVNGAHKFILELHAQDHSPVTDATGATISASVSVTVSGG